MSRFIRKTILLLLPVSLFFLSGLLLPTTPRASTSLLFANVHKDDLLRRVEPPRMIFVGGSNLSFGLKSQMIRDELAVHPINTGLHAGIGIRYMFENTLRYVREGDVVVLCLEYDIFFRNYDHVSEELFRTVFDVNPSRIRLLSLRQLVRLLPYVPGYTLSKLSPGEYGNFTKSDVYSVDSFNEFGDVDAHWTMERREFAAHWEIVGNPHQSVVKGIRDFHSEVTGRGADLIVTFPGLQDTSFRKLEDQIARVAAIYDELELETFGPPQRYKIPDSMMFDTPYHLAREGVIHRTRLFIEDYRRLRQSQADSR